MLSESVEKYRKIFIRKNEHDNLFFQRYEKVGFSVGTSRHGNLLPYKKLR